MTNEPFHIFIVDDEQVVRDSLSEWFAAEGYAVASFSAAEPAFAAHEQEPADLVIADIRMPGLDGVGLLEKIKAADADTPVILLTGYASVDTAVRGLKAGAFDYITKPFDPDALSNVVRNALEQRRLRRENRLLREQLADASAAGELIGSSAPMRRVREQIETVARVDSTVLLTGESGTGKELAARAIHRYSNRSAGPFIAVHCGALTETLVESELFGYERGAFTGASARRKGKFELAHSGTLFLDEIADISLRTQTDLLRVLQEREIVRVGGSVPVKVDFRVIAATNQPLWGLVEAGRFRSDLYYRLNVFNLDLPPLRDHKDDIPLLATRFLETFRGRMGRRFSGFDREALDALALHNWPGNVRELENVIERAVVIGREPVIRRCDLALGPVYQDPGGDVRLDAIERRHIEQVLHLFGGNRSRAAKALGIDRVTLYHKLRGWAEKPHAGNGAKHAAAGPKAPSG